jgi:formate dehydrogenase major subunit
MGVRTWIQDWPVYRQLTGTDPLGRGAAAQSDRSKSLTARTETADSMARSVCPYCAVGCGLIAYTKEVNGTTQLLQIEGDPDSPINEGRLCPKGATAMQLATSSRRILKPLYRAPGGTQWEEKSWDFMLDKIAQNLKASRDNTFVAQDGNGNIVNRTEGVAFAGGAAFSSEEGYFAAKVMRSLGVVYIEQQARV